MQSTEGTTTHPISIKKNCNTCQHKVAPLISNNLHDMAYNLQDTVLAGAPNQSAKIAKQYHFDAIPAKQYLATILQFLDLNTGGPSFKQQRFSNPDAGSWRWHYWHPPRKKRAMPPKWCQRWAKSILQCFWNTTWDILTHQNIEKGTQWAWPAPTIAIVLM